MASPACEQLSGCRQPDARDIPHCASVVKLIPVTDTPSQLRHLDSQAKKELDKIPRSLLSNECKTALEKFICIRVFEGCAHGRRMALCRSVCEAVTSNCNLMVLAFMPSHARAKLRCSQYGVGGWPRCAAASLPAGCMRSAELACASASSPVLVESPCGLCGAISGQKTVVPLPVDSCGLCNGDNSSCAGCDGMGTSFDACAVCNGSASVCQSMQTDSGLLGYVALVSVIVVSGALVVPFFLRFIVCKSRSHTRRRVKSDRDSSPADEQTPTWAHRFLVAASRASATAHRVQAGYFRCLGLWVACRPRRVLAISVVTALIMGCGLLRLRKHDDPLALWVPVDSVAMVNAQRWQLLTGQPRWRMFSVLLSSQEEQTVSIRAGLLQALSLHQRLVRLRVLESTDDAGVDLLEACQRRQQSDKGSCGTDIKLRGDLQCCSSMGLLASRDSFISALMLWSYDLQSLISDPQPSRTLLQGISDAGLDGGVSAALLRDSVSLSWLPNSSSSSTVHEHAGLVFERIEGLRALQLHYALDGSLERRELAAAWERQAADLLLKQPQVAKKLWPGWKAHVFCEQILADELMAAIKGDTLLIVFGYVLMCIYTSLFLSRRSGIRDGRGGISAAAVLSVGLPTLAAFGICAGLGVLYNETVNIAIFVLMGVGVDDAFVIVRALEDLESEETTDIACAEATQTKIGNALADCGTSILLSSATNALAFALGANTPLPALQSFCIYASVGMLADFMFQVTFFVAAVTLDESRRSTRPPSSKNGGEASRAKRSAGPLGLLVQSWWPRLVLTALYMGTFGASTIAAFRMPVGLMASDLVPSGSETSKFFMQQAVSMPQSRQPLEVLVQHVPVVPTLGVAPLSNFTVRHNLRRLRQALAATGFVRDAGGVAPLWLDMFSEDLRRLAKPSIDRLGVHFDREIARFMSTSSGEGMQQVGAVICSDSGEVVATRMRLVAMDYGSEAMLAIRATVEASGLGHAAFAHSSADIYFEQDAVMLGYTVQNLAWLISAVLAAVLMLSADVGFTAAIAVCVLSCCTHMFGWMMLTRTPLNALSLIPLLLSVGLCIDYSMHIAHAFWVAPGDAQQRAVSALKSRGGAVAHGGASTGLSQLLLLFGRSLVFTTFFKVMAGMLVVGLFHALMVLPACLSLVFPAFDGASNGRDKPLKFDPLESENTCASPDRGCAATVIGHQLPSENAPEVECAHQPSAQTLDERSATA